MSTTIYHKAPRTFVHRKVHSLMGLLIVLFLFEHLLTNSQAALFLGDDGIGFVRAVNFIHNLPYLPFIETFLIGVPIAYHAVLGIGYAWSARYNNLASDGGKPVMKYTRNTAYFLQRLSSWVLLVGIILHVSYMRFYRYPVQATANNQAEFLVRLDMDRGLYTLAPRLGVKLYDAEAVETELRKKPELQTKLARLEGREKELSTDAQFKTGAHRARYDDEWSSILSRKQALKEQQKWLKALSYRPLKSQQVIAVASTFGDAVLLTVRDTFKSPIKVALYTFFVLAASFHALNGLWTFCISWGIIIKESSQHFVGRVCWALMGLLTFLGLASIWGTYWLNLQT